MFDTILKVKKMSKKFLKRSVLIVSLIVSSLAAQDKVDAIEAARQAKAAAEKAAADAELSLIHISEPTRRS